MKELSKTQKAEAYDEVLERAKNFIENGDERERTIAESIFDGFMEESEDERIRKDMLDFIRREGQYIDKHKWHKWIAWLEKQGEQKHKDRYTFNSIPRLLDMIEPTDRAKSYCQKLIDSLLQEGYTTDAKIVSNCLKRMKGEEVSMATMDEQKLADKIEPKFDFNVGQWIVATGKCVYLIVKIDGFNVTLVDTNGDEYVFDASSLSDAHLWDIQDAKDGDILVCPNYVGDKIPNIFIFKEIIIKDNDVYCHCAFSKGFRTEGYIANVDSIYTDFYPATKQQRDTLLKAMTDAGYAFDFDKKWLIKS